MIWGRSQSESCCPCRWNTPSQAGEDSSFCRRLRSVFFLRWWSSTVSHDGEAAGFSNVGGKFITSSNRWIYAALCACHVFPASPLIQPRCSVKWVVHQIHNWDLKLTPRQPCWRHEAECWTGKPKAESDGSWADQHYLYISVKITNPLVDQRSLCSCMCMQAVVYVQFSLYLLVCNVAACVFVCLS